MKILIVGDPHGKFPKKIPERIDLIIILGDLGKADLARKRFFENIERKKKGLSEIEDSPEFSRKVWKEIYDSAVKVARYYSRIAPVYSLLGNVGAATDSEIRKDEKELGIKLPHLRAGMKKIKNFHIMSNRIKKVEKLKIGFLEFFLDVCWFKTFGEKDKRLMESAKKGTAKAKKILKNFGKVDILISHQPPYGVLDKITGLEGAPKKWRGKHAGSKVVLDYIKKQKPKYVFCGHIHEGKGKKKIGKTTVINTGFNGDYFVLEIK
jgi:Icc-related predicted phosphoesterase